MEQVRPVGDGPAVVLHIGEPKTGTTHFQEVVWRNRALLTTADVHLAGHSIADAFRAAQDLRGIAPEQDDPNGSWVGSWNTLAAQARSAHRLALISQETIAAADAEQVGRAVRSLGPDVHVVLTVRDFASLLPAEWQETVKHRRIRGWQDWLDHVVATEPATGRRPPAGFWRVHDTPEVLRVWSRFVPAERIHVVTVPRRTSDPDVLWRRLAGLLGIERLAVDSDVRRNPSLGMAETEFLRRLNTAVARRRLPNWFYATEVKHVVAHEALAERPARVRPVLPPEIAAWAERRAEATIAFLTASGVDVVGDLSELRPQPLPDGTASGDATVPAGDQLDAAVHALAAIVERGHQYRIAPHAAWRPVDHSPTELAMAVVRSSPRLKRAIRALDNRPAGARARVVAWRLHEAVTVRRGQRLQQHPHA